MHSSHRPRALPGAPLGREREWRSLSDFLTDPSPGLRLGIVSGRRRSGRSYVLRALCEAVGGLYFTAISGESRERAPLRFDDASAVYASLNPGTLRPQNWGEVLTHALDITSGRSTPSLLVIDDFPHLCHHSPEIPYLIRRLLGEQDSGVTTRLILCGSATSQGQDPYTRPLRERAAVDLRLGAFDFRTSKDYWQIDDPLTALRVHAVLRGAAGYRALADRPSPNAGFDDWITRTLLDPGRAVYSPTETEYLLREDPRITQHTLYYDILSAIAQGASTPSKIGAALGRRRNAVTHPLDVLESTGYIHREQDLLRTRHPVITLADPVIRFNQLITLPQATAAEEGNAEAVWQTSLPTFNSKILGPHFEELARTWTRRHAHEFLPGGLPGPVGTTEVPDPAARTKHEVDVIALALGERPQSPRAHIALLGEAKATAARRGMGDLQRLERIRDLLAGQGYDTSGVTLALFSLHGFHKDVEVAAAKQQDVLLVDLARLYGADASEQA